MRKIGKWMFLLSSWVLSIFLCLLLLRQVSFNIQHSKAEDSVDRIKESQVQESTEENRTNFLESQGIKEEKDKETEEYEEIEMSMEEKEETQEEEKTVVLYLDSKEPEILFGGDVCLQDFIVEEYEKYGVEGIVTKELRELMVNMDIVMVNQEFAFSNQGKAEEKQYTYRMSPDKVSIFRELGIDIVTLANNHTLDYGRAALSDTFLTLEAAGIYYVGAGENLEQAKQLKVIDVQGKKIGFLGASRVIPYTDWNAGSEISGMLTTYSPDVLLKEIEEGKKNCDILVVYVHWGEEKKNTPEKYQRTMAKQYIDAGADAVIGSHPHVMQGIEYYKGKPIVYSLGNYIFTTRTRDCSLAKVKIMQNGEMGLKLIPFEASRFPIRLLKEEEKREFFRYMESISFGITIDEEGNVVYNGK